MYTAKKGRLQRYISGINLTSLVKKDNKNNSWPTWFTHQLGLKLSAIFYRLLDFIRLIPVRLFRIGDHFRTLFHKSARTNIWGDLWPEQFSLLNRVVNWHLTLLIYLLELLGIGEIYETITDFLKFNTRAMTAREIAIAQRIYGNQINYRRVRFDAYAYLGPRQQNICYVSFYLINSWGKMSDALLIHELVHIWQYEQMGAVYMPRALAAQASSTGYDYGGVPGLRNALGIAGDLRTFNLEQQGDIMADYYRIRNGQPPEWGNGQVKHLAIYAAVIQPALGQDQIDGGLASENLPVDG